MYYRRKYERDFGYFVKKNQEKTLPYERVPRSLIQFKLMHRCFFLIDSDFTSLKTQAHASTPPEQYPDQIANVVMIELMNVGGAKCSSLLTKKSRSLYLQPNLVRCLFFFELSMS